MGHGLGAGAAASTPVRAWLVPVLLTFMAATVAACGGDGNAALRISGSTTVNPVAADAAEILRTDGDGIVVDTLGGSAGGIAQLAAGEIDIAMSSKAVSAADREDHAGTDFVVHQIGADAVGIVVDEAVVAGGVTNLTRAQVRAIFEGEISNWSEVGGPDLAVFVIDKEPGRGTREVLIKWLYGDAPSPSPPTFDNYSVVGGNEEALTKLSTTSGAVGPLSTAFAASADAVAAVALDGVAPTTDNLRSGTYPLVRPLLLLSDGPATGAAADFIAFVQSAEGQRIVSDHAYLTMAELDLEPGEAQSG